VNAPPAAQCLELVSSASAAHDARAFVHRVGGDLSGPLLDDLLLVISELVTNSVVHGPGHAITVVVAVTDAEHVRGEVRDDGVATASQRVVDTGRDTPGGFGLMLVDRLTSCWGIREGSTHVWFELAPVATAG
jgi:anti-sigma regulatory factor (Ser/Thr protein kinase)